MTRLLAADSDATAANGRRALGLLAATAGVAIVSDRSQQQRQTINADGGCWRLMGQNSIRNRGRTDRKRSEIYRRKKDQEVQSSERNVARRRGASFGGNG
jgi:hypothetical protein